MHRPASVAGQVLLHSAFLVPAIVPTHPGEILQVEYLEPLGVTQHRLAVAIGVPLRRINEIVHGKRRITADTALRLARYFGTSERFWPNLQSRYELEIEPAASSAPSIRSSRSSPGNLRPDATPPCSARP